MPIPSLHLEENERVLLVLHRHWFVLVRELSAVVLMIFVGFMVFSVKSIWYKIMDATVLDQVAAFLFSVYALLILALLFAIWINYRLDVWIITTKRVIDVEQRGLFNREVSEFLVANIQDITTEVPTMIMTLFGFGNMTIQTAGHKNFTVREIPNLEEAKRIILECSRKVHKMGAD
ncbi:MAG: Uncharacterized protein G01um101470_360 [Parcubacteria group bacterium Gr01-1014_70]|nr:MAG: Uncharacterized protein G01um101470_360 [Parcubacteria group bacterium Gr01-1014_70]